MIIFYQYFSLAQIITHFQNGNNSHLLIKVTRNSLCNKWQIKERIFIITKLVELKQQ